MPKPAPSIPEGKWPIYRQTRAPRTACGARPQCRDATRLLYMPLKLNASLFPSLADCFETSGLRTEAPNEATLVLAEVV